MLVSTAKWMTLGFYISSIRESPAMEKTLFLISKARKSLGLIKELVFASCRTGLSGHSCLLLSALSYLDHWYVFITKVKGGPERLNRLPALMWGVCGQTEE